MLAVTRSAVTRRDRNEASRAKVKSAKHPAPQSAAGQSDKDGPVQPVDAATQHKPRPLGTLQRPRSLERQAMPEVSWTSDKKFWRAVDRAIERVQRGIRQIREHGQASDALVDAMLKARDTPRDGEDMAVVVCFMAETALIARFRGVMEEWSQDPRWKECENHAEDVIAYFERQQRNQRIRQFLARHPTLAQSDVSSLSTRKVYERLLMAGCEDARDVLAEMDADPQCEAEFEAKRRSAKL